MKHTLPLLLQTKINWSQVDPENSFVFSASLDDLHMQLKINDFPEHPFIYSFVSEVAIFDSLDLPEAWILLRE